MKKFFVGLTVIFAVAMGVGLSLALTSEQAQAHDANVPLGGIPGGIIIISPGGSSVGCSFDMVVRSDSAYRTVVTTTCGEHTSITWRTIETTREPWGIEQTPTIRQVDRFTVCGIGGGVEGGCQITVEVINAQGKAFAKTWTLDQSCDECGNAAANTKIVHTEEPPIG